MAQCFNIINEIHPDEQLLFKIDPIIRKLRLLGDRTKKGDFFFLFSFFA
jgi:hypothetical protein